MRKNRKIMMSIVTIIISIILIILFYIFGYKVIILGLEKSLILKNFTRNKSIFIKNPGIILDKTKDKRIIIDEDFLLSDIEVDLESSVLDPGGIIVNTISDFLYREKGGGLKDLTRYYAPLVRAISEVFEKSGLRKKKKRAYDMFWS